MLLMMEIRGFDRPSQFKPTPQMPSRRARAKAPTVQVTELRIVIRVLLSE
jgi:hypothetical protein